MTDFHYLITSHLQNFLSKFLCRKYTYYTFYIFNILRKLSVPYDHILKQLSEKLNAELL
jgi:hypothetical protein